ncbi:MAG TPA: general stress protein [Nocardioidaceae bacterium]|nr:general stress protein [Nocardioidaceae bacterium]
MTTPMPLPAMPDGIPVGTFPTYAKAQEAVDYLSDNEFPVQNVTIVGSDLRLVEKVTGRLTRGKVVQAGALTGALWGLFMGTLIVLFASEDVSIIVPIITALIGAAFGAVSGYLAYSATGGKRDFTSSTGVVARSYEVICQAAVAEDARNLLGRLALRNG